MVLGGRNRAPGLPPPSRPARRPRSQVGQDRRDPVGQVARGRSAPRPRPGCDPGPAGSGIGRATTPAGAVSTQGRTTRTRRRPAPGRPDRARWPAAAGGPPTRWSGCRTLPRSTGGRRRRRRGRRRSTTGRAPPGRRPEDHRAVGPRHQGVERRPEAVLGRRRATSRWHRARRPVADRRPMFLRGEARVGCRTSASVTGRAPTGRAPRRGPARLRPGRGSPRAKAL